jgi:hypothetical protein
MPKVTLRLRKGVQTEHNTGRASIVPGDDVLRLLPGA